MPLGAATLRAHLDWRFESSWYADCVHNKGVRQDPANKGDASLTSARVPRGRPVGSEM
jgi:hypothetical protein